MLKETKHILVILLSTLFLASFQCYGPIQQNENAYTRFLSGNLYGVLQLNPDTTYQVIGTYIVHPGAKLLIIHKNDATGSSQTHRVIIQGDYQTKGTILVLRGGQVQFQGQPDNPIVFTSSRAPIIRQRGDWGGLLILGRAPNNGADSVLSEANLGYHGGKKTNDSSGTIQYIRVEYAGASLSGDISLAGVGLNSVGYGTSLSYIQTHFCASDGFRFSGGNVNAKYLVSTANGGSGFKLTNSWIGKGQFWVCVQDKGVGNHGIEVVNNATNPNNTALYDTRPYYTSPIIYNATLIGGGGINSPTGSNGINIDYNAQGLFYNCIVSNFGGYAFFVGQGSANQFNASNIAFQNSLAYVKSKSSSNGNASYGMTSNTSGSEDAATFNTFSKNWNNIPNTNPLFTYVDFVNPMSGNPLIINPQDTLNVQSIAVTTLASIPVDPSARYTNEPVNFFNGNANFMGAVFSYKSDKVNQRGQDLTRWVFHKWIAWYRQ